MPHPLGMNLRYTPTPDIRAAVWLVLNVLSVATTGWRTRLGIGPLPCKPFLTRTVRSALARFLSQAEPALRRCLHLAAAELGPLASLPRRPQVQAKGKPGPQRETQAAPILRTPRFRIFESERTASTAPPPRPQRLTGPSIRRFDVEYVPDLREYPQAPGDILPAAQITRRLVALDHALEHRQHYIDAIRKRLGTAAGMIRKTAPRLFRRGPLTPGQQSAARLLEDEALAVLPHFNSS